MLPVTAAKRIAPINDPNSWSSPAHDAPRDVDVAAIQKEIDSIIGLTRNNESQAKLVWNGDRRYWRTIYTDWNAMGEPTEVVERPIVLHRTVRDKDGKFVRDEFPPRWLVLIRREKEQYAPTWERDSKIFIPDEEPKLVMTPNERASRATAGRWVRVKPTTPPENWYRWFMTIADHDSECCRTAAREYRSCYGNYASPRKCLKELQLAAEDRRQREAQGEKTQPFVEPDRLTEKLLENSVNNYGAQCIHRFNERASRLIDSIPFADVRQVIRAERDKELERLTKQIGR